ncbi:MAG: hypothetical protein ACRDST_11385 [Pseudonocardiaceae bacterium]
MRQPDFRANPEVHMITFTAQSADFVYGGTPWQDQTRIIGRALGQQQRTGELVATVDGDPATMVGQR